MQSTRTLSTLVTVLVAALIGIAPMASRAAESIPDSPDELRSDSKNNSQQCSTEQSPSLTGCAPTGKDRDTSTTNLMQTVEEDSKQAPEQVDTSRALLGNLITTGPDRYEEGL